MDGRGRAIVLPNRNNLHYLANMTEKTKKVRPSDLPTKRVRAPDGTVVSLKVVKADSPTLGLDLLAAFQSNVTRVRAEQKRRQRAGTDAA